ncbi:MAG TPA: outer membrane beta-barrel protein [Candidatus Binatia bacterium]|nr:outer membrane beta-barrel protein [Candidatus Binatia bacterium]
MRAIIVMAFLATLTWGVGGARADEAAPAEGTSAAAPAPDPTRGQWDSFLDPLRDFEDNVVTGTQKQIEDATKIHFGLGLTEAYTWDFNNPRSGSLIANHSMEHHNDGVPAFGQLSAARPSDGWFIPGFGLKLDAGKGARDIKSDWNGNGAVAHGDTFETNDFDVEEAYLTWTMPDDGPPALKGLTFKGGKFVTLLGAEVIEPWANFNYSRSLLFSLAIPFTHTGGLVTYPITDKLSVTGGAVEGWDKVASNNNGWSGIGNVTYTVNDQVTLAGNAIGGPEQTNKLGNKREVGDLVATIKPTSALTLLLNYDYGHEDHAALNGDDAFWQGFAAVANYNLTDRASVAVRGEWFEDHGGSRTNPSQMQTLYEGTLTGKYLITQHLYGQVEYRHDESTKGNAFPADSPGTVNGPTGPNPITKFTAGQDILGFNVTYVFN